MADETADNFVKDAGHSGHLARTHPFELLREPWQEFEPTTLSVSGSLLRVATPKKIFQRSRSTTELHWPAHIGIVA